MTDQSTPRAVRTLRAIACRDAEGKQRQDVPPLEDVKTRPHCSMYEPGPPPKGQFLSRQDIITPSQLFPNNIEKEDKQIDDGNFPTPVDHSSGRSG